MPLWCNLGGSGGFRRVSPAGTKRRVQRLSLRSGGCIQDQRAWLRVSILFLSCENTSPCPEMSLIKCREVSLQRHLSQPSTCETERGGSGARTWCQSLFLPLFCSPQRKFCSAHLSERCGIRYSFIFAEKADSLQGFWGRIFCQP